MATKLVSSVTTFVFCFLWMMAMKSPLQCSSQGDLSRQCAFFLGGAPFEVGANNYLNMTTVRADFLPYGIDFPTCPTGSHSCIFWAAMKMGLNFSPPAYLSFVAGTSGTNISDLQSVLNNGGSAQLCFTRRWSCRLWPPNFWSGGLNRNTGKPTRGCGKRPANCVQLNCRRRLPEQ
ncbi:hypothetical protein LINGRAHAP2_LOCUS2828, partial [Linum grandiflorum]